LHLHKSLFKTTATELVTSGKKKHAYFVLCCLPCKCLFNVFNSLVLRHLERIFSGSVIQPSLLSHRIFFYAPQAMASTIWKLRFSGA